MMSPPLENMLWTGNCPYLFQMHVDTSERLAVLALFIAVDAQPAPHPDFCVSMQKVEQIISHNSTAFPFLNFSHTQIVYTQKHCKRLTLKKHCTRLAFKNIVQDSI
jgi:hypothetical protein